MGLGLGYSLRLGEVEVGEKVEEEVEGKLEEGVEGKVGQEVGVGAVSVGGLGPARRVRLAEARVSGVG